MTGPTTAAAQQSAADGAALYDEQYYRQHCGPAPYGRTPEWLALFQRSAVNLIRIAAPRTVLDVGCAWGLLVEAFWDHGVEATGIDVSEFALSQVRADVAPYCRLGSVTDPIPGRYDLVTCIEVLEHVPPDQLRTALGNLAAVTDTIFFSSSPDDFDEPTHCSVRPPIAWIRAFAEVGFVPDPRVDVSFLTPYALLFRRAETKLAPEVEVLVAERSRLGTALVAAQQRESALTATIRELEQRATETATHVANLEAIEAARRTQAAAAEQRIGALERTLAEGEARLRAATAASAARLEAAAAEAAARTAELASRNGVVAVRDAELRHLSERLAERTQERDLLARLRDEAEAAARTRADAGAELESQLDALSVELVARDRLLAVRESERRQLGERLAELVQERDGATRLRAELAARDGLVAVRDTELRFAGERLSELSRDREMLLRARDEADERARAALAQAVRLRGELAELGARIEALAAERAALDELRAQAEARAAGLGEQLAARAAELDLERARLDGLLDARLAEVRAENDALQQMIDTVRTSKFWRLKLALARAFGRPG